MIQARPTKWNEKIKNFRRTPAAEAGASQKRWTGMRREERRNRKLLLWNPNEATCCGPFALSKILILFLNIQPSDRVQVPQRRRKSPEKKNCNCWPEPASKRLARFSRRISSPLRRRLATTFHCLHTSTWSEREWERGPKQVSFFR